MLLLFQSSSFDQPTECLAALCLSLHHVLSLTLARKHCWQDWSYILTKVPPFAKRFSEHIPFGILRSLFICNIKLLHSFNTLLHSHIKPTPKLPVSVLNLYWVAQAKTNGHRSLLSKRKPKLYPAGEWKHYTFSSKFCLDFARWANWQMSFLSSEKEQPASHSSHFLSFTDYRIEINVSVEHTAFHRIQFHTGSLKLITKHL